jgi:hydroxyacylglutathione hydrolase
MRVHVVPCLRDNYAYLIHADGSTRAVVVDPSEALPVEEALRAHGLDIGAVLATHHHWDHVGGIPDLIRDRPSVPVVSLDHEADKIPTVTRRVGHGEHFSLEGLAFSALHIPGHTMGAAAYVAHEDGAPVAVFTGDTLFVAGCGRLFEGTPAMMQRSLCETLATLPDGVAVYCGHEYTEANLRFCAHVEPENADVAEKSRRVAELRGKGTPTVPSTLGEERKTNVFLRCNEPAVRSFAGAGPSDDVVETFTRVRKAKDEFGLGATAGKK